MDRMTPQAVRPYKYPSQARPRRHGPRGYKRHNEYRDWLEDEFHFRCAYCLKRKVWSPTDIWCVEHLVPQSMAPHLSLDYENLVFACQWCNDKKQLDGVPDPLAIGYGQHVQVNETTGEVEPLNKIGQTLIRSLRLNHSAQIEERRMNLRLLNGLAQVDPDEWKRLMDFPEKLLDLSTKKPPGGNSRPNGIHESCFQRRRRGELPAVYEE